MAAPKRPTHTIVNRNVYMGNGKKGSKLQEMPVGKPMVLTDEQAEKLGSKVKPITDSKTLDLTKGEEDTPKKEAPKKEAPPKKD